MFHKAKRFISLLVLSLFLFPLLEVGIHSYIHRNDTHCFEKSKNHFHALEHSCSICDYTLTTSADLPALTEIQIVAALPYVTINNTHVFLSTLVELNYSPRGPPSI